MPVFRATFFSTLEYGRESLIPPVEALDDIIRREMQSIDGVVFHNMMRFNNDGRPAGFFLMVFLYSRKGVELDRPERDFAGFCHLLGLCHGLPCGPVECNVDWKMIDEEEYPTPCPSAPEAVNASPYHRVLAEQPSFLTKAGVDALPVSLGRNQAE